MALDSRREQLGAGPAPGARAPGRPLAFRPLLRLPASDEPGARLFFSTPAPLPAAPVFALPSHMLARSA
eukprot:10546866-Alexandrium_andersonii.AAC.1